MDYIYTNAVDKSPIKPCALSCYVDDSLNVWPDTRENFLKFQDLLGTFWESMTFKEEIDEGNGVVCLDMKFHKGAAHNIEYDFYQKPTNSGRYLHYRSHCSMALKKNLAITEAAKVYRCSRKDENMWKHIDKISKDFISYVIICIFTHKRRCIFLINVE